MFVIEMIRRCASYPDTSRRRELELTMGPEQGYRRPKWKRTKHEREGRWYIRDEFDKEACIVRVVEIQLGGYVDVSEGGFPPKLPHE